MLLQPDGPSPYQRARPILVNGYRPLQTLERALASVAPGLVRHGARPIEDLLAEYGPLTEAELSAITSLTPPELASSLEEAAARGRVVRKELRGGALWQAPDPALAR